MFKHTILLVLLVAVTGCAREVGSNRKSRENFGVASANNTAVHRGERDYVVALGKRFAKEVPTTINFAFNSARLDGQARAILDRQADWINQFPEVRFTVYGHTDAVGSNGYNRALGQRRANATVRYLVSKGIDRRRLQAVVSFGETRPVIDTPDRERRNRRTVTEVSGFLKRHQTLDGRYAAIIDRDYVESAVAQTTLTQAPEQQTITDN
ncbi:OmpA family protein [Epibacterium sp. SM1979]|uniref:OmpA family protein n=1 Tax=Tritonibacter litoralis TaxID=2662264 RepID=A0A843YJQ9_9RHOB|nr:OmpA family protein [Tritonibacter litoralis]MQQ09409.1 OmpA family protein [Tritonibacter litoralis]